MKLSELRATIKVEEEKSPPTCFGDIGDEDDLQAALSLLQDVKGLLEFITDIEGIQKAISHPTYKRIDDMLFDMEVYLDGWEFPKEVKAEVAPSS